MNDWDYADPRNKLWKHYARILDVVQPKMFVLENVPELLKSAEFEALEKRLRRAAISYKVKSDVLNASHYGVPQPRRRAIVIGSRVGEPHLPPALAERRSVRDAIVVLKRRRVKKRKSTTAKARRRSFRRPESIANRGSLFCPWDESTRVSKGRMEEFQRDLVRAA